jgi:hypothetical protein
MDVTRHIPCSVLFVAAIVFIVRANLIFFRILDEVNTSRPASGQISFLFVNLRLAEVMTEHGKLFPIDQKRRQMKISVGIGFGLLLAMVLACFFR